MKKDKRNKIIIAVVIVMLFNYISPTVSQAGLGGGSIFDPIANLLITIADYVLEGMQYFFVGNEKISFESPPDVEYTEYRIRYSPGIIFSGKIAPFKVNFFDASDKDKEKVKTVDYNYEEIKRVETKRWK